MATSIFQLVGSIMVDNSEANKSLSKTDDKAKGVGESLLSGAKSAGKFAAGLAVAAAGAVGSLVSVAKSTAESMDEIDKASQRMGITAESYQELRYQAELTGVSMSTLEKAAKSLDEGVSFEDAMSQIYALEDAEERAQLAAELFGDSVAYQLTPMLNQSGADMAAMAQEANDLGLVLDEDSVVAGANLNDAITKVTDSFKALGNNLGAELLPIVSQGCDLILEFMPTLQNLISEIGPVLTELLKALLPIVLDLVEQILPPLIELVQALLPLFQLLCELILPILTKLIQFLVNLLVKYVIPAITKVVTAVKNAISNAITSFTNFKDKVVSIFGAIRDGVKKPINAVLGFINSLISGVTGGINSMIRALNSMSFDVPDWVPLIGGEKFGFNLKELTAKQIPLLAEGAVIEPNKPFAAILGDQKNGTNIEAPLDTIKQAVSEVINEIVVDVNFAVEGDPNNLFKAIQKESRTYTRRTGKMAFA